MPLCIFWVPKIFKNLAVTCPRSDRKAVVEQETLPDFPSPTLKTLPKTILTFPDLNFPNVPRLCPQSPYTSPWAPRQHSRSGTAMLCKIRRMYACAEAMHACRCVMCHCASFLWESTCTYCEAGYHPMGRHVVKHIIIWKSGFPASGNSVMPT